MEESTNLASEQVDPPVIETRGLYKIFGPNPKDTRKLVDKNVPRSEVLAQTRSTAAVVNAGFKIAKSETFVIMGLSGSGKSTLVRLLNRLIEPTYGEVYIDGQDITKLNRTELRELRRSKFGMVFQQFALLPHRNVVENVEFGLEIRGAPSSQRREKAIKAIHDVGLGGYEESPIQALSGGMQQRVGLARALATNPEILFMDEAFSALDPLIRTQMQDELIELQARLNKTVVFITHDLDEALKLGDRIAIMKDGVIEQIGTPETILTEPASDYVRSFVRNVDRGKVLTADSVMTKSQAVARQKDGPSHAVRIMRQHDISSLFVVDNNRCFVGLVTIDETLEAIKKGAKTLDEIVHRDVLTVETNTLLRDMLPLSSGQKVPIPVLREDGRMVGIVTRAALLLGLSAETEAAV
jgi:glycine betaine/proline transport system ATP-binding protein